MAKKTRKDWIPTMLRLPPELFAALTKAHEDESFDGSKNDLMVQAIRAELVRRGAVRP